MNFNDSDSDYTDVEFQERGQQQRTPVVLLLDASDSMHSKTASGRRRIDELNAGLGLLQQELQSDEVARSRVCISIIVASGNKSELTQGWIDADQWQAPPLKARGGTPLGHGALMALEACSALKVKLTQQNIARLKPWIVTMSDGAPTDGSSVWRKACDATRQAEKEGAVFMLPIGVDGADLDKLSELSSDKRASPLSGDKFKEFVSWLGKSLSARSMRPAGATVQLPAPTSWLTTSN